MAYFEAHCTICGRDYSVQLPYDDSVFRMRWDMWAQGKLIQNVFPELTPQERESLKTGTCGRCWDKIFEVKK